mmetsp:Transcript_21453/g.30056  ORF Transcript_21453/g.30056 Transcript_21453/m.30056 type:complete len:230 (+) Transcript_21453:593-1282(+)
MAPRRRNAREIKVDRQALRTRHLLPALTEGVEGSGANVAEALLLVASLAPAVAPVAGDEDQLLIQLVVGEMRNHLAATVIEIIIIEMQQERGSATVTTATRRLQHAGIEIIGIIIGNIENIETAIETTIVRAGKLTRRSGEEEAAVIKGGGAIVRIEKGTVVLTTVVGTAQQLAGGEKEVEQETRDEEIEIVIVAIELIGQNALVMRKIMLRMEEREAAQSLSKERKRL